MSNPYLGLGQWPSNSVQKLVEVASLLLTACDQAPSSPRPATGGSGFTDIRRPPASPPSSPSPVLLPEQRLLDLLGPEHLAEYQGDLARTVEDPVDTRQPRVRGDGRAHLLVERLLHRPLHLCEPHLDELAVGGVGHRAHGLEELRRGGGGGQTRFGFQANQLHFNYVFVFGNVGYAFDEPQCCFSTKRPAARAAAVDSVHLPISAPRASCASRRCGAWVTARRTRGGRCRRSTWAGGPAD